LVSFRDPIWSCNKAVNNTNNHDPHGALNWAMKKKAAVLAVLDSGMLPRAAKVAEFEQAFADYCGVKHAIATNNGRPPSTRRVSLA